MLNPLSLLFIVLILATSSLPAAERDAQVQLMAASCANCHGTDGRGADGLPPLAGQPMDYLAERLLAFRHDLVPDTTVMSRIAKGYSDTELRTLAEHFANLTPDGEQP